MSDAEGGSTTRFGWPAQPRSAADLEALMRAIDGTLSEEGLKVFQRPLHIGRKLWEAFGWGGSIFPPRALADQPGFDGDVLMAKAQRWYEDTYGERLKADWAYGFAPVRLGNNVWRVRAGLTYGRIRLYVDRNLLNKGADQGSGSVAPTSNVLCEVDGLPQGVADRLSDSSLREYFDFYLFMFESLQWRDGLPRTELLNMAGADYDESTASVLGGRYGQARWAAQQAVEKTLKGLLAIAGTKFPTGGPNGHNLDHIAGILAAHHGITINAALLKLAACSPKVRYGDESSNEVQALQANHSVLGVLEQLRKAPKTAEILQKARTEP